MKRLFASCIILLFLSTTLSGCAAADRIVPEVDYANATWVDIDAAGLEAKLAAEADFILVVSSETCSSCAEFKPVLDAAVATYGIVLYKIEAGSAFPGTNDVFDYEYTPTVAVFRDGVAIGVVDPDRLSHPFESLERFLDWLDRYVVLPPVVLPQ